MKRKTLALIALVVVTLLVTSGLSLAAPAAPSDWQSKVDPWVLDTARAEGQTEFLVFLADQADLSAAAGLSTKLEKGTYVYETLSSKAAETQGPVLNALKDSGAEYRAYWVANMIWVRAGMDTVEAMARRADVARVYANPTVHMEDPVETITDAPNSPDAIEWNISKVNAPQVWAAGFTGQGAVIGGQDTGYQWEHPALQGKYRGWNGSSADHNYNWHDSIHSGSGGSCGLNATAPCDDSGHGTHTMGTMVGDDGGANQIGMAPGAKWIGCRNMDQGNGTPTSYSECYQWFIAPTDLNDANPNPAMAPDVINNSWSCPASEGCTDPNALLTVVNNVRAAGIMTVHSAGNSGSACSTVNTPSAIYDASYSVGSTTSADAVSSFSSRGPVTVDGSNRLKPDIAAPGSSVRSSYPTSTYATLSGTSMAGPHVAGLVALLVSVRPDWAGNVDQLETIINQTAFQGVTNSQTCGGIPPTTFPNNVVGYGRIDAYAAYQAAVIPTAVALSNFSGSPAAAANALPMLALPAATGLALAGAYIASKRRRS